MSNFEESWNPHQPHEAPTHLSKNSQTTLQQLTNTKTKKLTGWLADLVECTPAAKQAHADTWLPKRYALIEESAFAWIDTFSAEVHAFVREFNNSASAETVRLVFDGPKLTMSLPCKRDPSYTPYKFTCYQSHVVSHNYALLIRSYYETIQIFIVPSEKLLDLENDFLKTEFPPLLELRPAINENTVLWASTGTPLRSENIPIVARELFSDFLKLTLGVIEISELFGAAVASKSVSILHSQEKENLTQFIRDLQVWRTGSIFTQAIARDKEALSRQTGKSVNLSSEQFTKVQSQYNDLEKALADLVLTLKNITENA
ncbi:MAG: hypothetical protein WC028_11345 [Candidatus Obscuribacterales bacterium]|jgi:hypothetical protein